MTYQMVSCQGIRVRLVRSTQCATQPKYRPRDEESKIILNMRESRGALINERTIHHTDRPIPRPFFSMPPSLQPYNWPHMQAETFEPSFKPALEPTETVAMDIVSSADAALFAANSTGGASDGPNLERAEAEQGHSRAPGSASTSVPDGVALPKIGKHSAVDGNEAAVSANSSGVVGATRGRVRKPPR